MDKETLQKIMDQFGSEEDFDKVMGIELIDAAEGYCRTRVKLSRIHANPAGTIHGGVLYAIMDSTGGWAAASRKKYTNTCYASINYLRAPVLGQCKEIIGEAREIKAGKTLGVYEVTLTGDDGTVFSVGMFTFFIKGELKLKE